MRRLSGLPLIVGILFVLTGCQSGSKPADDIWNLAVLRKNDLKLSTYITAHSVQKALGTVEGRRETLSLLHCNGITKVYVEVYRSGLTVAPALLKESVDFLQQHGFEVVGGIATVPGDNFGVQQDGPLTWFNWQNEKTQNDLREVMKNAAPIFNTFIIDDFLCTADTSMESKTAKGNRSWSEYRRDLLTKLSESVFIQPAKAANPNIKMIIKYPQWYDRFHLFGYDVAAEPPLYDSVWVGTESRGQYTQRFGFVQPYLGFINYRWLATFAGSKIGGAWFDHGDCTDEDFIEQAYQSVLAGAKELVIFNFDSYITGHPGHHLLRKDWEKLANLAAAVAKHPVQGPVAYKPANSDAGNDLFLMDYIGMFGISLVPESHYPDSAKVIFLPTQAAADSNVVEKAIKSLGQGARIVVTTGFLASAKNGKKLAEHAQIKWPIQETNTTAQTVMSNQSEDSIKFPIEMKYQVIPDKGSIVLQTGDREHSAFLIQNERKDIFVLNTHTFSQQDYDAVGEMLLPPRPLGILEVPETWANTIRSSFKGNDDPTISAPARISYQRLADGSFVLHNYNREKANIEIQLKPEGEFVDGFTGEKLQAAGGALRLEMAARSRIWVKKAEG